MNTPKSSSPDVSERLESEFFAFGKALFLVGFALKKTGGTEQKDAYERVYHAFFRSMMEGFTANVQGDAIEVKMQRFISSVRKGFQNGLRAGRNEQMTQSNATLIDQTIDELSRNIQWLLDVLLIKGISAQEARQRRVATILQTERAKNTELSQEAEKRAAMLKMAISHSKQMREALNIRIEWLTEQTVTLSGELGTKEAELHRMQDRLAGNDATIVAQQGKILELRENLGRAQSSQRRAYDQQKTINEIELALIDIEGEGVLEKLTGLLARLAELEWLEQSWQRGFFREQQSGKNIRELESRIERLIRELRTEQDLSARLLRERPYSNETELVSHLEDLTKIFFHCRLRASGQEFPDETALYNSKEWLKRALYHGIAIRNEIGIQAFVILGQEKEQFLRHPNRMKDFKIDAISLWKVYDSCIQELLDLIPGSLVPDMRQSPGMMNRSVRMYTEMQGLSSAPEIADAEWSPTERK